MTLDGIRAFSDFCLHGCTAKPSLSCVEKPRNHLFQVYLSEPLVLYIVAHPRRLRRAKLLGPERALEPGRTCERAFSRRTSASPDASQTEDHYGHLDTPWRPIYIARAPLFSAARWCKRLHERLLSHLSSSCQLSRPLKPHPSHPLSHLAPARMATLAAETRPCVTPD